MSTWRLDGIRRSYRDGRVMFVVSCPPRNHLHPLPSPLFCILRAMFGDLSREGVKLRAIGLIHLLLLWLILLGEGGGVGGAGGGGRAMSFFRCLFALELGKEKVKLRFRGWEGDRFVCGVGQLGKQAKRFQ